MPWCIHCTADPFAVLGPHEIVVGKTKSLVIRAFLPEARLAWVVDLTSGEPGKRVPMDRQHADGFFTAVFPGKTFAMPYSPGSGRYRRSFVGFRRPLSVRPSPLPITISTCSAKVLITRTMRSLGAHLISHDGFRGVHFAVWAPNAVRGERGGQLQPLGRPPPPDATLSERAGSGRFSCPTSARGKSTSSRSRAGLTDIWWPRPIRMGSPPNRDPDRSASIVWDISQFEWTDQDWVESRTKNQALDAPDLDLRMPHRFLEAQGRGRWPLLELSRAC